MKTPFAWAAAAVAAFVAGSLNPAAAADAVVNVGDAAPVFTVKDDTGAEWKSTDVVGKKILVVYFYPADHTGGCTKQACGFRDDLGKLKEAGVEVVGVSGDTVETHQTFKKAQKLNFPLLADDKGEVAKAFGVPFNAAPGVAKATIDGKEMTFTRGGTAKRWTFVIGLDGKIAYKDTEVKADQDSKKIQEAVAKLKK